MAVIATSEDHVCPGDEEEAQQIAVRRLEGCNPSFRYLGSGTHRDVYLLSCSHHVVKIDQYPHGYTLAEIKRWNRAGRRQREVLCPILATGEVAHRDGSFPDTRRWVIMPLCADVGDVLLVEIDRIARRYFQRSGMIDWHENNFGYLQGRLVMLDYAL